MCRTLALCIVVVGCAAASPQRSEPSSTAPKVAAPGPNEVRFDHRIVSVFWGDGDTFSFKELGKRHSARLKGFNALESYGPVHRWGDWAPSELFALAKKAGVVAAAKGWDCRILPGGGGYGRKLVDCPNLRDELLRTGLAHVFSMDRPGDPSALALQHQAQAERLGIWAKGVPEGLVTSIHSRHERPGRATAYDRVVDAKTGHAPMVAHKLNYAVCQEVCHRGSCMIYVPYKQRYGGDRASCLR